MSADETIKEILIVMLYNFLGLDEYVLFNIRHVICTGFTKCRHAVGTLWSPLEGQGMDFNRKQIKDQEMDMT